MRPEAEPGICRRNGTSIDIVLEREYRDHNDGKATVGFFTGREQAVYSAAITGITTSGQIVQGRIKIR